MNYEDLLTVKQVESSDDGAKVDNTSSDRWSTEVDESFDKQYHLWLGEKLEGGVWKRKIHLNRMMNEKCASYLISQINSRFNKNINFSVIEKDEIIWMIADMCDNINEILIDNYEEFEIDGNGNSIQDINDQVKAFTYSLLKIPFMGGMRIHIGEKNKTIINKQEVSGGHDY